MRTSSSIVVGLLRLDYYDTYVVSMVVLGCFGGFTMGLKPKIRIPNSDHFIKDARRKYLCYFSVIPAIVLICLVLHFGSFATSEDEGIKLLQNTQATQSPDFMKAIPTAEVLKSNVCKTCQKRSGIEEALPSGIISGTSDLEMKTLWGSPITKENQKNSKSLLAMAVGIKQKDTVDEIVRKFLSCNINVMLFHYDCVVDGWKEFDWANRVIHVSASNQTKWWFAKRFLHPDIVSEYRYVFLWDEDINIENFHPGRYLSIVGEEGLEISQPALDSSKSEVHHQITVRSRRTKVHRRIHKSTGRVRCFSNSTSPPCTGWVEMMVPVFSRASWRCAWHMIQNDLIHAWGLDMKLGYCAQGDRMQKVGVVDAEYVVHKGIPSLGSHDVKQKTDGSLRSNDRLRVRDRSSKELNLFNLRWRRAVEEDKSWTDPYPEESATKAAT